MIAALFPLIAIQADMKPAATSIELVGICNITPDGVTAWDKNRKALPDLAQKIQTQLTRQDYGQVTLWVGRKNRWIVFRVKNNPGYYQSQIQVAGKTGPRNFNLAEDNTNTLQIFSAATAPGEKTVDASATFTVPTGEFVRIEPKAGTSFKVGSDTFRLGEFSKASVPNPYGWRGGFGPRFGGGLGGESAGIGGFPGSGQGASGADVPQVMQWTALATGPEPTPKWGWPTALFGENLLPLSPPNGNTNMEYVAPLGALRLTLQVDPATVRLVTLPIIETKLIEFKKIPLDK